MINADLPIKGIDVSHFQDPLDWNQVKSMGYQIAFAKATDGEGGSDRMFLVHKKGAKDAGLLFGAYHFFRFSDDPIQQMLNFLKVAGPRLPGELPHSIDVEWDKQSPQYGPDQQMDKNASALVLRAKQELQSIIGVPPIIYTNFYFWCAGNDPSAFADSTPWIPAYNTTPDKVKIPAPWDRTKPWFWQKSEHLQIGDVRDIDENIFWGTEADLLALTK